MTTQNNCANCAFGYKPKDYTPFYECHRYPPVRVEMPVHPGSARWDFPVVDADNFCGEYISEALWKAKNSTPWVKSNEEVYL